MYLRKKSQGAGASSAAAWSRLMVRQYTAQIPPCKLGGRQVDISCNEAPVSESEVVGESEIIEERIEVTRLLIDGKSIKCTRGGSHIRAYTHPYLIGEPLQWLRAYSTRLIADIRAKLKLMIIDCLSDNRNWWCHVLFRLGMRGFNMG